MSVDQKLDGVIRRTADDNEVHFERHLDAPVEKVWPFVADPNELAKWMGGPVDKLELSEGGAVVIQIAPQFKATVHGKVLEYERNRLLYFTWEVPAWGKTPDLLGTRMRWEVEADGDGTRFLLTHAVPYGNGREHLLTAAWHLHLDQLEQLVAGNDRHYRIEGPVIHDLTMGYLEDDYARRRDEYEEHLNV
jgi:uncharacterized protein YndB with AHSA1/START domain